MKREFLENLEADGVKLTKEMIDKIMAENGKDINAIKDKLTAAETERDGFKQQIEERDNDIKDLQEKAKGNEDLTKQLEDLQAKYDGDTAKLNDTISDLKTTHATEKFFEGYQFASDLAKEAAMSQFKAKGFKQDEKGEFLGAKEWIENLKTSDPAAFKQEPKQDDKKLPQFVSSTNGNQSGSTSMFNFGFAGVRKKPEN